MEKIKMNMELLNLIILVQDYKRLKYDEIVLFGNPNIDDNEKLTQEYYNKLPNNLLNKYGLDHNITSFRKIISYPISKYILETPEDELSNFEF